MANKIQEKRIELEALEILYSTMQEKIKDVQQEYKPVGKHETQATDWRTGELKWDDEEKTIPHYDTKWDYVPKEKLTEEEKLRIEVYENIITKLEKLM